MMNANDHGFHAIYEGASPQIRAMIESAFHAARDDLRDYGLPCDMSDGAECLIAAITRYVMTSVGTCTDEKFVEFSNIVGRDDLTTLPVAR